MVKAEGRGCSTGEESGAVSGEEWWRSEANTVAAAAGSEAITGALSAVGGPCTTQLLGKGDAANEAAVLDSRVDGDLEAMRERSPEDEVCVELPASDRGYVSTSGVPSAEATVDGEEGSTTVGAEVVITRNGIEGDGFKGRRPS